ncbi:MAG: hypothetical protein QM627_03165 [Luteolibacter sp.]
MPQFRPASWIVNGVAEWQGRFSETSGGDRSRSKEIPHNDKVNRHPPDDWDSRPCQFSDSL